MPLYMDRQFLHIDFFTARSRWFSSLHAMYATSFAADSGGRDINRREYRVPEIHNDGSQILAICHDLKCRALRYSTSHVTPCRPSRDTGRPFKSYKSLCDASMTHYCVTSCITSKVLITTNRSFQMQCVNLRRIIDTRLRQFSLQFFSSLYWHWSWYKSRRNRYWSI